MPSVIFSGSNVKALKSNLDLNGESLILNGEFSAANNTSNQTITGLIITPATYRSAEVVLGVAVDATADLYESFKFLIINKGGSAFEMSQSSAGDNSTVTFSITSGGQVQITTPNFSGFVSCTLKWTATMVNI